MPTENSSSASQIHSHRYIDLAEPNPADIILADIAHALSNVCRFGGHTMRHYSVAQHALAVSVELESIAAERYTPGREVDGVLITPAVLAIWGLHHDDEEAYLGDMQRPHILTIATMNEAAARTVRVIKRRMQNAVAQSLGLPHWFAEFALVKQADNAVLGAEGRELLRGGPIDGWADRLPAVSNAALSVVRSVYVPHVAEEMFLARCHMLAQRAAKEAALYAARTGGR